MLLFFSVICIGKFVLIKESKKEIVSLWEIIMILLLLFFF